MGERNLSNIFLIGFSYSGKSQAGRKVAERLGWDFTDTDDEIVAQAKKPIPEIFAEDGEERFRELESQVLMRVCPKKEMVIATGGGIILAAENRELMKKSGVVVCLQAEPDTIYNRLLIDDEKGESKVVRPLLSGTDPERRIAQLKEFRQPYYSVADWTVHTDSLTLEEVAVEVIRGWNYIRRSCPAADQETACVITTATESYPILVGWDLISSIGRRMRKAGLAGTVYIMSDDQVFPLYGPKVTESLREAGFSVDSFVVPHGEKSKSIEVASRIYDFLVKHRAERGEIILALGGGMVGDLAGFVAATYLRGMPLLQVPTSLMAMVDSSIGGKVAINHPEGKNLIGAFYQPRMVLADTETLTTLTERELASGWAEVVKHGLIRDADYFQFLEQNVDKLKRLEREAATEAIRRSAAIKAAVVNEDEKETGLRAILNYGHTIAHGLETATGYNRLLHGEAVSVGMMGEAEIAEKLGLLDREAVERQRALLLRFGLPVTCPGVDTDAVLKAIELDKKVQEKAVRWVLLRGIGEAVLGHDVLHDAVRSAIEEIGA
ncbi:3-dehydroquinate synthase [Dehalococcoidia bacterium]|nr:3-dehydroquinate synthase [Dehalococcoidia bacterium]